MARTNVEDVRRVISTTLEDEDIEVFVADAGLWVDEELAASGMSADRLELIERYLTCALIRMREAGLTSATLAGGRVSESYQRDPNVSEYLKHAAALDTTGKLRQRFAPELDKNSRAGFLAHFNAGFTNE